ncbi:hypothetical protein P5G63_00015 [Aeromonas salmonicida]|uniref:hypothetical protein n=1 Tax=Aeromonas salmonicida TaxID=645 RepID=UPI0023F0A13A|nr:hypothetical protein [Aeromonas salmonicida]MDF8326944.1 hypothetical protein [Aeromonas salmonicida]
MVASVPQSVTTGLGNTLTITAYNPATGLVSYSYTLTDNEAHPSGGGNNNLFEDFAVTLVDSDGDSANNTLSVRIVDDVPTASNDSNPGVASEASLVLDGNVLGNDVQGADGAAVTAGTLTGDLWQSGAGCWTAATPIPSTRLTRSLWRCRAGRRGARCSPMC